MKYFGSEQLEIALTYPNLIPAMEKAFEKEIKIPIRAHHTYRNPRDKNDSDLLMMPAWDDGEHLGVKLITVTPGNNHHGLPSIQGTYTLFDLETGTPLVSMDGKMLTLKRTAATSAMASTYLSDPQSTSLLMIGNGAMAPELIKAHTSIRPIEIVYVWGRDQNKTEQMIQALGHTTYQIESVSDLAENLSTPDIISCATLSPNPLINGELLRSGQHLDLVGSYRPEMREADDVAILRSDVYVDTYEGALKESGDLIIPMERGILTKEDLRGELVELVNGKTPSRTDPDQITCFKSVGHAIEDLYAAIQVWKGLQT